MPNKTIVKRKRIIGIDVLRILSMFFIINHHIIYHGGPLLGTKKLSLGNNLLLFLNTIFCSGVNIFGMISGFVGFQRHKYSNLIFLLFQTYVYNYGIAFLLKQTKVKHIDLHHFLFPLFAGNYWYFSEYFILYFFLPLLNSGIKFMEKKEFGIFNLSLFIFFSCFNQIKHYSRILNRDFLHFNNGFTYMWLIILYFFGSYLGRIKNNNHNCNTIFTFFICFTLLNCIAFLRNVLIKYKINKYNNDDGMKVEYTSPSSLLICFCFFIMFSDININNRILQKIISFFAPLTYGIYLLHNHILVLNYIIKNKYYWLLEYNLFKLIVIELFESLKIFLFCSIIDYLRLLLFKILKIRQLSIFISYIASQIGNRIILICEKIS